MKIEGPNKTGSTDSAKKKDKTQKGDGSFGKMLGAGETQESKGAGASQSITQLDALLAVQGAEDPAHKASKGRMVRRADVILEHLERLRNRLLTGTLTVGDVLGIADVVAAHREKVMDPRLTAILDEIDLRAQVEIAKLQRAL